MLLIHSKWILNKIFFHKEKMKIITLSIWMSIFLLYSHLYVIVKEEKKRGVLHMIMTVSS